MGGFNTFYLLLNPGTSPADVTVTYLRAGRSAPHEGLHRAGRAPA